jgi:hypothetical protein
MFAGDFGASITKMSWVMKIEGTRRPRGHKVTLHMIFGFSDRCTKDSKLSIAQCHVLQASDTATAGSFGLRGGLESVSWVLRSSVRVFRMGSPKRADR